MNRPTSLEDSIFAEALSRPAEAQGPFLDGACRSDPDLKRRILARLRAAGMGVDLGDFDPAGLPPTQVGPSSSEGPGTIIGRYRLIQSLGTGGMGTVHLAQQESPVRRRVALKIIKLGMDTAEVIARFEAERQALALMNHPNIARVHDGGATEAGRPYFVMELVEGVPITRFCDLNRLAIDQRLRLFIQVCAAIQHAHQRGIIHRDIKPSNILVGRQEGLPIPKVIDFGIAKAIDQRLTDHTYYTLLGQAVGTPLYMSPEQREGQLDIDTRADVYSLGALLHELLVGHPPRDTTPHGKPSQTPLHSADPDIAPPSLSYTRAKPETKQELASARKTTPANLTTTLAGDLDWITLRALERDRTRRYDSASDLARDIERHLAGEAVLARPPSTSYRLSKFVRRHQVAVAATLAILLSLVAGFSIALHQSIKAKHEATKSLQVSNFLKEMLQGVGPARARGRDTTLLREILDTSAQHVGTALTQQPDVEFELRSTIGNTYGDAGDFRKAQQMLHEAVRLARLAFGNHHTNLAHALTLEGKSLLQEQKYSEALHPLQEALQILKKNPGPTSLAASAPMKLLATAHLNLGQFHEAETFAVGAVAIRSQILGPSNPETLDARNTLAWLYYSQDRFDELEPLATSILQEGAKTVGPEDPLLFKPATFLALVKQDHGRYTEAAKLWRQLINSQEKSLAPDHPDTLASINALAVCLGMDGRFSEAETLGRSIHDAARRRLGPEAALTLATQSNLAEYLRNQGRFPEAEHLFTQTLAAQSRALGPSHPYHLETLHAYCLLQLFEQKTELADATCLNLLNLRRKHEPQQLLPTLLLQTRIRLQSPHPETALTPAAEALTLASQLPHPNWHTAAARCLHEAALAANNRQPDPLPSQAWKDLQSSSSKMTAIDRRLLPEIAEWRASQNQRAGNLTAAIAWHQLAQSTTPRPTD